MSERKIHVNRGRPLTERHKRAIREGVIRAKLLRELKAKATEETQ